MTPATLYVSITHETVSDAQASLRRFIDAGLNPDSPRVRVAIGDPLVERDIELEQRGIDALT